MHKSNWITILLLLAIGLLTSGISFADQHIAVISKLRGAVYAEASDGTERRLSGGDKIAIGEKISTGKRSHVVMKFTDKSRFELGSNADMTVSKFSMGNIEEKKKPSFVSKVSRGIFRFVSGLIAKQQPNAMRVRGAVATIGIRGTHVVGEFKGDTATVILLEPEGEPHPTAIDVSNEFGSVTIDEPGFGTEVPDANSPPSPPRRMKLNMIRNMTQSIRAVQRISAPRPRPRH